MKPAPFDYQSASTIDHAIDVLREHGDEAKVLAGGQSLVPMMAFRLARPSVLLDINRVEGLDQTVEEESTLRIGALTRHVRFEQSVTSGPLDDLLRKTAKTIGHLPIRTRGTFGGSIAHADPAAEWCVLASTIDAEMVARSSTGERVIPANTFFHTTFTTALRPDEILTEVRLPILDENTGVGFAEYSRRHGDFAIAMVMAVISVNGDSITEARLGAGGISDRPVRLERTEATLRGKSPDDPDLLAEAATTAAAEVDPMGDIHGSPEYRRDLVGVLTSRALAEATGR